MAKTAVKKNNVKRKRGGQPGKRGPRNGPSRRSQQRLIALRMGLAQGTISKEELKKACEKKGCYNAPNFSMDMKKDGIYFVPIEKSGKVTGWKLSKNGKKIAAQAEAKIAANKGAKPKVAKPKTEKVKGKKAEKKTEKKSEQLAETPAAAPAAEPAAAAAN